MAHHKHPPIKRRKTGKYAPTEFAFLGTTCARLDPFLDELFADFAQNWKTLLVTGSHGEIGEDTPKQYGEKVFRSTEDWNEYDDRLYGSSFQLALVNGNHYPASAQVVFVDPKKAGTLKRRRDQLTRIVAVILCPGATEVPGWLLEDHPDLPAPMILNESTLSHVSALITEELRAGTPAVKALILVGGKSTRMGVDKASLVYQKGLTEAERLSGICEGQGLDTYFSVSTSSGAEKEIPDRFMELGPMGAIASAFLYDPEAAWLVLACDLPMVDEKTVALLLESRDSASLATAIRGASKSFPEPLIALYEPEAYGRLLQFLSIGYACPRKVLINSKVKEVVLEEETPLTNANTPAERAEILKLLKSA